MRILKVYILIQETHVGLSLQSEPTEGWIEVRFVYLPLDCVVAGFYNGVLFQLVRSTNINRCLHLTVVVIMISVKIEVNVHTVKQNYRIQVVQGDIQITEHIRRLITFSEINQRGKYKTYKTSCKTLNCTLLYTFWMFLTTNFFV